ncbi:serine/threonine protein kinase [Nocardioides szechwanensis]|uniref:non-specific serine/threonine protein kinase n=1 Tax=Nocardioides szechwanensis TaxID=1005944 RepID=A0A1H0H0V6_9ACTN|nr:serine/threonine-protein kinase [Nocardioides szechwanensis]GEP34135.1 serine/threonine protein kinase [Nocardioides szechwanensis]SDO12702.1 Serine/threonine protein kinase [Nocardioides szechwanensis]
MDSPGTTLPTEPIGGRYRVEREVGRGGMGSVWLAQDERLGRPVAVKRVGRLPGESLPHLARAMREARSSAALNHPNVVSVYDAVEEGEHLWLVMEYVPGRTLAELVAAEGALAPERVARIGAQVAEGLAAAHALGTVHRDVKPGNVLVGDDDAAKISDFGIARSAGDDKLTQTGLMTGTPAYFAPELARGNDATPASDVWGLGATLYAAVEGHSPYPSASNPLALMARIAHEEPPLPQTAGPLRQPISRMMDVDPAARPTMAECADVLRRAAAGPTTTAARPALAPDTEPEVQPAPPVDQPRRRRSPLLIAGVLALLLLVAGIGFLLLQGREDGDPSAATDEPSTSKSPKQSQSVETTPEQTPEETPEETTAPPVSSDATTFAEDYYSLLPDDTNASWKLLTKDYQKEMGRGSYEGFWNSIDDVTFDDAEEVEPGVVDVTITYLTDGSEETEVRRLYLEEDDGELLIAADEVVG